MDILDDTGVSKLSAKVFFFKVNYSFNFFSTEERNIDKMILMSHQIKKGLK